MLEVRRVSEAVQAAFGKTPATVDVCLFHKPTRRVIGLRVDASSRLRCRWVQSCDRIHPGMRASRSYGQPREHECSCRGSDFKSESPNSAIPGSSPGPATHNVEPRRSEPLGSVFINPRAFSKVRLRWPCCDRNAPPGLITARSQVDVLGATLPRTSARRVRAREARADSSAADLLGWGFRLPQGLTFPWYRGQRRCPIHWDREIAMGLGRSPLSGEEAGREAST